MALRRLGQILIDLGTIDEDQLEAMLAEQAARGSAPPAAAHAAGP